jgi:signal transduction histidine kinase
MRAFDLETKNKIAELQAMRLDEARRREALRGGLIKRIVAAQEAERQRIARELHDDTGQALTAIGLGLRGVSTMVKTDQNKAIHNLRMLEDLSSATLNEIQRIISNLRPAHLDDLGLAAAIRWYLSDVQNLTDMEITFQLEGDEVDVEDEIKLAVYRVVQEAITNAIKHSRGTTITIILCYTNRTVDLWIEDDGVGIKASVNDDQEHRPWGLVGMRERATLLGGEFLIESSEGEGAKLRISIPYDQIIEELDTIEEKDDPIDDR